jgi:cell division protein FtsW
MQPSEFLKVFMIIWVAKYYDLKEKKLDSYTIALYPALVILVAFMAIFFQPDLGTALIVLFIFAFMFLLSPIAKGIKVKISLIALAFAFLGFLILFGFGDKILSETQLQRIRSVGSNPCSEENYYTDGNQLCNGYIAINNGGLTGKGLGKSIQKYLYLPEAHTDFIFCIIIEELGVLFGIFIMILYMVLLGKIVHLGKRATTNRDALICFGGAFYIFIHIMVNLLGVFGIIPMTGVPLPFMSYGGSYLLSLSIMLAVIQRISFETRLKEEAAKGKK